MMVSGRTVTHTAGWGTARELIRLTAIDGSTERGAATRPRTAAARARPGRQRPRRDLGGRRRIQAQGLPRSPADEAEAGLASRVELQSLEEDRLGRSCPSSGSLRSARPSPRIRGCPRRSAPTGSTTRTPWPRSSTRCGGARSPRRTRTRYQAPFRSGANVEAYQLEPLRRALQSARTNLLLADDVGLGKTIEAGLVVQELLLRHRARSVIIVCPPSLALKWQDEMREKFGLRVRDRQQRADGAGAPHATACTPTRSGCSRG